MTPKDLEHWAKIFKAGSRATTDIQLVRALEGMGKECRRLRDEEDEADREGGDDVRV